MTIEFKKTRLIIFNSFIFFRFFPKISREPIIDIPAGYYFSKIHWLWFIFQWRLYRNGKPDTNY